ncbi:ABC transporter ATP-binding protein [Desulfitobacterium chlororespirans]|uniref:Putative ABC transport system ATP-binding protein n=1 Tax=Desulfitobacterium chlororespirans DSM 11544 TaxID=1121395 RepID=A0A1M7SLW1_9FIRM|nr:ABC transporter ATP-binding protein [Desulfitobacterium chlororespirans]SHN59469.1 putative ABC transport system ATP-binding protein [Desulfitobacterium chlororespirans DSM 11544]
MKQIVTGETIVKYFGKGGERVKALDKVSLQINEGEFIAVMGPSGSGKSTLLFALSGLDGIDSGKVMFEGRDISLLSEHELADLRRTKIGFVFQQPTLLKNLNILDNILLPAWRGNRKNTLQITEKARKIMKRAGIAELEKRDITQVSGGQLQRAGICRALLSGPEIIFGDEPTGALNSTSAQEVMSLFSEINREGTAVMLVTHDARVAAAAERILFMSDGKIVSEIRFPQSAGRDAGNKIRKITAKMQEIDI